MLNLSIHNSSKSKKRLRKKDNGSHKHRYPGPAETKLSRVLKSNLLNKSENRTTLFQLKDDKENRFEGLSVGGVGQARSRNTELLNPYC